MLQGHQQAELGGVINGRYRIEQELGRGGMARVCRVLDEHSGERFALKQMLPSQERSSTLHAMFEREYHTLVQLAHPRIVRVCDYGVDAELPYYTMELLEGCDARDAARNRTLSVGEVCVLLRDAASALALIHSRRMVHRDVSVRNLWCTPDGRGKLIDFGTLVAMGPQARVAGTPPFVPPEAVYLQPLDARCDLFGLGALAYYLLTKRNAYPAREIGDLRQAWRQRPRRPDTIRAGLPRALADLVMSLLNLDLRGRPSSAAEVCDRLTAIGELSAEDERHLAQAFLTSPKLVGREEVSRSLRKALQRARHNHGGALSLVAPAGYGRSRMLASFVLEAKLMGAAAISVDATAVGSDPLATARTIAERLVELLPMLPALAVEVAGIVGHLSPVLHRAFGEPTLVELKAHERTRRLAGAVTELVTVASRTENLMIAVDDVHRADDASLGVLARLNELEDSSRLMLVTTCDDGALGGAPPALEQLVKPARRIVLTPIGAQHTRELLGSLFGEVPGLDQAASWLHELSQGSPQTCMQYAQHLVDHGLARYEGGQWKLPADLRQQALPETLGAILEERVARLSADARALALGMALARDDSRASWQPEYHVRIEDYAKLLGMDEVAAPNASDVPASTAAGRAYSALDELLQVGIVEQRDTSYVLGQRAMVDALLRITDAEDRRATHLRLARIFEQPAYGGRQVTISHLQRAGEHRLARQVLAEFSNRLRSATMQWSAMRISVSARCAQDALLHWQAHGGTAREGLLLRRLLLFTSSVYDWSLARSGDAQIAQLRSDCGLVHWEETDPAQPPAHRVLECIRRAQQEFDAKPEGERGLAPPEAVRELASCAVPLQAAFGSSYDVGRLRMLPQVLEPLRPLSPLIGLVIDLVQLACDRTVGRELGGRTLEVGVERLFAATDLPDVMRSGATAMNLYAQSLADARCGRQREPELMSLVAMGTGDDMFLVVHARWLAHAFGGKAARAKPLRRRAEVVTEDDVWRRKATLNVEAELFALTGDLLSLQRTADAIAELAETFEGWRPWLAWTRAEVHRLRGDLEAAQAELNAALALAVPGEHRAWLYAAQSCAELRLVQGDADAALIEAHRILYLIEQLALDRTAIVAAERVCALAHSRRGDHAAARGALERAFTHARALGYGGLPLAVLHEAQGRIAVAAGDTDGCTSALVALHDLLEHADAPALIGAYEALRAESNRIEMPELFAAASDGAEAKDATDELTTQVRTRLSAFGERHERALQVLQLLLEDTGATIGHLFLFDSHGLFAAASVASVHAGPQLLALAQQYVDRELTCAGADAVTVADTSVQTTLPTELSSAQAHLTPVLLAEGSDRMMLVGIALLGAGPLTPKPPRAQLLRAISRCLQTAGDSVALIVDS